jgi:activator of HSP90 ATPase
MPESIHVSTFLPGVSPERVYRAWLDSAEHGAFSGGRAEIQADVGGRFTAWDGYIQGTTLELEPPRRILQSWRTTDFPADSPDSSLEILFEQVEGGTQVRLSHNNIPDGQGEDYRQGWEDYYFAPMQEHFSADQE